MWYFACLSSILVRLNLFFSAIGYEVVLGDMWSIFFLVIVSKFLYGSELPSSLAALSLRNLSCKFMCGTDFNFSLSFAIPAAFQLYCC